MKVYIPLPEGGQWGGACGVYRGFSVYVYDESRVRPNGSDDPYSKYYKYYPAKGAIVIAKFYDKESGWSVTVKRKIQEHQPVGEDIAWVQVGTVIPCDICKGRKSFFVSCDVKVIYKGQVWEKTLDNLIYVSCPYVGNPEFIKVRSSDLYIGDGKICVDMYSSADISVNVSLYRYDGGVYVIEDTKRVSLSRDGVRVCFSVNSSGRYGIALTKPGTNVADGGWVCGKEWEIRL